MLFCLNVAMAIATDIMTSAVDRELRTIFEMVCASMAGAFLTVFRLPG